MTGNPKVVPDPNFATIQAKDFATPEAAMLEAKRLKGANVIFGDGDYEVSLRVGHPNIRLIGTGKTYLYAKSKSITLNIPRDIGDNFQMGGCHVSGQTLAQAKSGSTDVSAVHTIYVRAKNVKLRQFSAMGAVNDSLYVYERGEINFEATDGMIDASNRNTMSVIAGIGMLFKDCHFKITKDRFIGSGIGDSNHVYGGLYFIDFEPNHNTPLDIYHDVLFENCLFENDGSNYGREQIVIQDNNAGNDMRVTFKNCRSIKTGNLQGRAPYIRVTSDAKLPVMRNIHVLGGEWKEHVIKADNNAGRIILEDCSFKDITLVKETAFSRDVTFSKGTVLENISTDAGSAVTSLRLDEASNVKVINVEGFADVG